MDVIHTVVVPMGNCRALALVDTRVSGTQPPSFGKKTGVLQAYSSGLSLGGTPRGVSKIDWSHPLSRGMTDCLVWNAGGSTPPQNLASPSAITTLTGSPIDAMTVAGPAGAVVSNVGYNIPDHLNYATGDVTIRLLFKPVSWPGGFTILFDKGTVSTREFSLFFDTSGNVQYVGLGGNSDSVAASTALTPGTVWDLVMQRSGTTLKFYVNGVFISNDHTTGWSSNTASGGNLGFGINPSGGGTKPDAQYITTQIWNRALDPSEISLLYSDPYCFLVPAEGEMPALSAAAPVQFSGTQAGSKQRGVLRAFSQGLDNLHLRQVPRGPVKIDWSHPILNGISYLRVNTGNPAPDFIDNGSDNLAIVGSGAQIGRVIAVAGGTGLSGFGLGSATSTYNFTHHDGIGFCLRHAQRSTNRRK